MPANLVIEDEEKYRRVIGLHLSSSGYLVKAVGTAEEGLKQASAEPGVDLVLTDLKLPGMDGLAFLEQLRAQNMHTPVIVMSAFGTVENAVEAMKKGAVDFLPKPFSLDHLTVVVEKALEVRKLREENRELREALGELLSSSRTSSALARACRRFSRRLRGSRPRAPPCCSAEKAAWAKT